MAVNVKDVRDRLQRELGGGGSAFDQHFIGGLNRVISDLNSRCFLALDPATGMDEIDLDEGAYTRVFEDGCKYYVCRTGEFAKKPDAAMLDDYTSSMAAAQEYSLRNNDLEATGTPEGDWGSGSD